MAKRKHVKKSLVSGFYSWSQVRPANIPSVSSCMCGYAVFGIRTEKAATKTLAPPFLASVEGSGQLSTMLYETTIE